MSIHEDLNRPHRLLSVFVVFLRTTILWLSGREDYLRLQTNLILSLVNGERMI